MAKNPAFLFYSQDFYTGVATLSWEDRGKFISILCLMHQQGRMSEETIRFIVGYVSDNLKSKFKVDDGGMWYNERLEAEIEKRNNFTESRRKNGEFGGRPIKSKPYGKPKQNHMPNHMGNHMEDENEKENEIVKEEENKKGGMGEKSRPHLFRESDIFDKASFTAALQKDERYAAAHIDYYHEVILNWSDQGNRKKNWLATAKNWILRDLREGKLVDKNFNPNIKRNGRNDEALRHGLDQLERIKAGKL